MADLEKLVEPTTRGHPETCLRWTCNSVRKLAEDLNRMGHRVSYPVVAELLHELNYSLQANRKTKEGDSHPDRNAQFEYIDGKVRRHIALGQPGASRPRIWAAIEAAQLTSLLGRLPDGLDTVLGERGWSISGGEAQRVALARAFLSDAAFVLVDEPTAHLDAATEAALIEPLARLLRGRTALVASHSDVVLGIADHMINLDEGRIRG